MTESFNHEIQVAQAARNPYKIVHGACLLDPRVQNGRNAHVRNGDTFEDDPYYSESEIPSEGRSVSDTNNMISRLMAKDLEGVMDTLSGETAGEDLYMCMASAGSQSSSRPEQIVYNSETGQALYIDDGLSCKRLPSGPASSFAQTSSDTTGHFVQDTSVLSLKGSFEQIARTKPTNPFSILSTTGIDPAIAPEGPSFASIAGTDFTAFDTPDPEERLPTTLLAGNKTPAAAPVPALAL